jgi:hypothetical protein
MEIICDEWKSLDDSADKGLITVDIMPLLNFPFPTNSSRRSVQKPEQGRLEYSSGGD